MGIMAIGQIIVLFALFFETFSAPSGCIESCDFHQTSYQSRHTSGGLQDHASLVEGSTHLNDHDYARPGNWTEHNQYSTDSGHGKVHEERGQYVEGSKRVRYFKKNFTSSYGNVNELGADLGGQRRYDSLHIPSNQHFESQAHNQLGQAVAQESGYNRLHSQQTQSLSTRIDSKSERLEDFGEYSGHSQVNQHELPSIDVQTSNRQHVETVPGNWSRVDSYKTDNDHGRVFEEEGQYVTGPKKVRYYKKNYTSSYSTSGVPQNNIGSATTLDELHSKLQRNLHKQLDNFRREFHEASSAGHIASATHVGSTDLTQETVGFHDLQTAESDNYRQQLDHRRVPSSGVTHHYTDHQERETFVDARQPSSQTYPVGNAGYDTQRTYQSHESRVSRVHPAPYSGHSSFPSYTHRPVTQVPFTRSDQTSLHNVHVSEHHIDETQRAQEISGGHRFSAAQNQLAESSHRVYNPSSSYSTYPGRRDETRHYEEQWSSSSHTGGNVAPDLTHGHASSHADRAHYDRDAYHQQRGRYHAAQGYDSHAHTSESNYNTAYRTSSGQLVTGSLDLGQAARGADCTEETQQYQQETRYHRKYKRDDHHGNVQWHRHPMIDNEDLTQQDQELSQTVHDQQLEDLMQQSEELTQQTEGQLEFGQQTIGNQHLEDLTQQNEQLTQQTQESDDFTQQTSGKLEFGQQTVGDQHLEDLTQQNEQLTQQTEGQLEFGQHTTGHLENLMQPSEQLTQQTSGKLEFGQQTVGDQHLEDLTQQNEQLTQQTEGQLEFGQHTTGHLENLMQPSEQLMQQPSSKLEFSQQTVGDQHLEDLTQQNEQLTQQTEGQLEFGQHTIGHLENLMQPSEQLTQQTSGKLEFGQQTVGDQHLEDLTQQSERLMHQTQDSDDFTQQTSGKLEFGQQTVGDQHLEDLTQQSERLMHQTQDSDDFTQQTSGKLEFGQQTVGDQHLEDLTQQNKRLMHQTQDSDDFTQQTSGKLEFGQQTVGDQHLEDLTQQTQDSDDFTPQINGALELGQQTQSINKYTKPKSQRLEEFNNNENLAEQTTVFNDFTQQTMGQQVQSHRFSKPKVNNQHLEDFTQQDQDLTQQVGQFNDFSQQTTGNLEYGQQRQQQWKPNWPGYDTQHSESFSQQNDWNLSQQSYQYPSHNDKNQDFMQQTDQQSTTDVIKPAPKPKPRYRLQKHDSTPSPTDATDFDLSNPIEVNSDSATDDFYGRNIQDSSRPTDSNSNYRRSRIIYAQGGSTFDNEKENMDRLHWVHKSNDATVGLQWHYTYHPSDLTNVEGSHDNYYPHHNINSKPQQTDDEQQQQPKSFDFDQQETQDKNTFDYTHENSHTFQPSASQAQHNKYDQQLGSFQPSESSVDNQFNQDSKETPSRVIPLQHNQSLQHTAELEQESIQTTEQTEHKMEPRILEAYGGGPYDPSRNDDIYHRVRPNPSATLPPIIREDPWDIREKPKVIIPWTNTLSTTSTPKEETTTTAAPPSFWNRLGHKITNTYDKAKEKAKEIFG